MLRTSSHFEIKQYASAFLTERENPKRPFSFSEVGGTIRFIVRNQKFYTITHTIKGVNLGSSDDPGIHSLQEEIFPIEVGILLSTESSMRSIGPMLDQVLRIPCPDQSLKLQINQSLKIEISRFASFWASVCPQRNARSLDLVIELDVREHYDTLVRLDAITVPTQAAPEPKIFVGTKEELSSSSSASACTICMDEYVSEVEIEELPCSHFFHPKCISKWLERNNTCPVCRSIPPRTEESLCGPGQSPSNISCNLHLGLVRALEVIMSQPSK